MRVLLSLALATMVGFAIPCAAEAKPVTAKDPSSVVSALRSAGYRAVLTEDDPGDPMINGGSFNSDFVVYFYGCTDNRNCSRVQLVAIFPEPANASLAAINEWNAENYFGRAYLAEDREVRLEMDINLDDGGMSPALFIDNMRWWDSIVADFEKYISKPGASGVLPRTGGGKNNGLGSDRTI